MGLACEAGRKMLGGLVSRCRGGLQGSLACRYMGLGRLGGYGLLGNKWVSTAAPLCLFLKNGCEAKTKDTFLSVCKDFFLK